MNENSLIDHIIKKWFPVIGVLFIVGGISYLFYDGIWQNLGESARVILGFIAGILFIAGGYSFEDKLRGFADAVIGGGILIFYVTLIYASRLSSVEFASIPEIMALLVALAFSFGIVFYSYQRKSKHILMLGALGGYLTPFFVGGEYLSYVEQNSAMNLNVFLIYFLAISLAVFVVAQKMFLKGIGLLNSIGLFVGTFSLVNLTNGDLKTNLTFLVLFAFLVLLLHIGAMVVNAKKFENEKDPFLVAGYILPLVWFVVFVLSFIAPEITKTSTGIIYLLVSGIYFGGWYYLRNITDSQNHFALYNGGLIALIFGILNVIPFGSKFSGLALSAVSLIFIFLFYKKDLIQREIAAIIFALAGFVFNLFHLGEFQIFNLGFLNGNSVSILLTTIPFVLLSPTSRLVKHQGQYLAFRRFLGYLAYVIIGWIFISNIISFDEIPISIWLFELPALFLLIVGIQEKKVTEKNDYFNWAVALAMIGFIPAFFTILGRFYPAPEYLKPFSTVESLIGWSALIILFGVIKKYVEFDMEEDGYIETPFIVTFSFYLTLWAMITYEVLGFFNLFGFDYSNPSYQGIRAFFVTLLWAGLSLYMLFTADDKRKNQKNIGFALLALTILKLIFYDLANVNTNLKVFLFILIGAAIMYVSYNANKKDSLKIDKK